MDTPLIRSRAAERARVEEIEQQGSRRIQCKAECALNPAEIVLVAKPSSVLHTVLDVLFSCLWCFWPFLFWWFTRAAWFQQHFKAFSMQCATVLCRSPNRAGAMADSQQVAAKHQQSLQPQSQFCFYPCWDQAAGANKEIEMPEGIWSQRFSVPFLMMFCGHSTD